MLRVTSLLTVSKMSQTELTTHINGPLSHWKVIESDDGVKSRIRRDYKFQDFHTAWRFMNNCVDYINQKDHHPEWTNVYNKVRVELTTHDAGNCVTQKDIDVAMHMETIAKGMN
eukprot:Tbor_TRINITY_DN5119_c0_g1::TRINITY_DN5119_c0_g1_i1::g.25582::m.25582/K01724/PCBD, phhB; 4a-hydroxytetrahydrobiopterin dehydratase